MRPTTGSVSVPRPPKADYIVTGNTRHFPRRYKETMIVTGRQFLDILAQSQATHE
jgi:hypothetical protein